MNYGVYKNVRNNAWQCLLDVGITELPVSVVKIADFFDIKIVKNSKYNWLKPKQIGISRLTSNGRWIICYEDTEPSYRSRFTIAHELGHILLGHQLKDGEDHTRTFDKDRPQIESEADMFAARILAPACVIWALDLHTPEEISELCQISHEAAEIRAKRMELLYSRNMFLSHPLERQVYAQFKNFIEEKKARQ